MSTEFRYDTVRYPSFVFAQFRPDAIGAMAMLHGVVPERIEDCRVLELGCGDGASLLSIAHSMPNARCVGVDLSKDRIAEAQLNVDRIGLRNAEFHFMDVMEYDPRRFGEFDFVVAHGLFSWVPPEVREKVLWVYKQALAPTGVGYISYNAYPGWHIRHVLREACRFSSDEQYLSVDQAQTALEFVRIAAANAKVNTVYANLLAAELKVIEDRSIEVLFHDELADFNQPYYFSQFVSMASNAGLAFLAESDPLMHFTGKFDSAANKLLDSMAGETIRREQCMDFLRGTRFRSTLICHAETTPSYTADVRALDRLYFASDSKPTGSAANLIDDSAVEFTAPNDSAFSTNFGFTKSFLAYLSESGPPRVSFNDVGSKLRETFAAMQPSEFDEMLAIFRQHVIGLYHAGVVQLSCFSPTIADAVSERPVASAFARWQMEEEFPYFTTPLGRNIPIESDLAAQLLSRLDGGRTIEEAADDLRTLHPDVVGEAVLSVDSVRAAAEELLKFGVLVS